MNRSLTALAAKEFRALLPVWAAAALTIVADTWLRGTAMHSLVPVGMFAYIVGSLPFIVFTLVYMINPHYMAGFSSDQRLMIAGLGGLVWMGIGAFIMAKMVNFEI